MTVSFISPVDLVYPFLGCSGFLSNIRFFEDLYEVSEAVVRSTDRMYTLKERLNQMNQNLPAAAYVPFIKGYYTAKHIEITDYQGV